MLFKMSFTVFAKRFGSILFESSCSSVASERRRVNIMRVVSKYIRLKC
jgi:hypothetical protein